jgi:DNA-directed RNA polymerase subunit RPC12/RpoP
MSFRKAKGEAMNYRCPLCGQTFSYTEAGVVRCPGCGGEVRVEAPALEGTAWDVEQQGRWAEAFLEDVRASLVDPLAYFARVGAGHGLLRPWIYALLISIIVFLVAAAYQAGFHALALGGQFKGLFSGAFFHPFTLFSVPLSLGLLSLIAIIGIPLGTSIAIVVQGGIVHLCLMLVGGARREFAATLRTLCSSMGPQLLQIVPLLGGFIAGAWQLVLLIVGLKVVHGTSYARSAVAVFLPLLVCCGLGILLIAMLSGWTLAALLAMAKG